MKNPLSLNFTLTPPQKEACFTKANEILYGGACGGGKAELIQGVIMTPFGERVLGGLKVGDRICCPFGGSQEIIHLTPIEKLPVFKVTFNDDTSVTCSGNHLWRYWLAGRKTKQQKRHEFNDGLPGARIATTEQIKHLLENSYYDLKIPLTKPAQFTKSYKVDMRPIHPYVLGVLLGDGCLTQKRLTVCKPDEPIFDKTGELGLITSPAKDSKGNRSIINSPEIYDNLSKLGLAHSYANSKFIPEYYKLAPIQERFELIRGLFDTDGYADERGHIQYTTVSEKLALDTAWVLRSLGCYVKITTKIGSYRNAEGDVVECQKCYMLYVQSVDNSELFYLPRKKNRCTGKLYNGGVSEIGKKIVSVEEAGKEEVRCLTVNHPAGLYLSNNFTVTHNSFLARAAAIYYSFNIPYLQTYFFRRFMDDIKKNHMEGPKGFRALLDPFVKEKMVQIVEDEIRFLETGAKIFLCFCNDPRDVYKYQSYEFHFLLIEEAGQFSEEELRFLRTRSRMVGVKTPQNFKNMFPRILYTANPGGQGHLVLKNMFIEGKAPNRVYQTPEDDGGMARIYIPAKIHDNPFLLKDDPGYIARLKGMGSPQMVEAFLNGNWNSVVGAFFPEFSPTTHVLKPFPIPAHWVKWMGYDSGFADPFSIGWYTKAANDMIAQNKDGQHVPIPAGSIIRYKEWYGANEAGKGLHLTVQEIINGIKERETQEEYNQISVRVASKDLFKRQGGFPLAKLFADNGIYLTMADDDRISGWNMVRDLMRGKNGTPELYVFSNCDRFIEIIPTCQTDLRKPEDMAQFNDHIAEELRYAIKAHVQQQPEAGGKLIKPASRVMQELTLDELYSLESKYANQRRRRHGFNTFS